MEKSPRLIARLDIKGPHLIKGVQLEGLRVIGDPQDYAKDYYDQGADELLYIDLVASLYGRSNLIEIVKHTSKNIFIPFTVGGGIRNVDDAHLLLRSGADKVAINSSAVKNPLLIEQLSQRFGSQSVVSYIEAKRLKDKKWEIYTDGGRERSGIDVMDWVREIQKLGAGEILLTSIDREGTRKGFDLELIKAVNEISSIPVIASGGYGEPKHLQDLLITGIDGVAFADAIHYKKYNFGDLRKQLAKINEI